MPITAIGIDGAIVTNCYHMKTKVTGQRHLLFFFGEEPFACVNHGLEITFIYRLRREHLEHTLQQCTDPFSYRHNASEPAKMKPLAWNMGFQTTLCSEHLENQPLVQLYLYCSPVRGM